MAGNIDELLTAMDNATGDNIMSPDTAAEEQEEGQETEQEESEEDGSNQQQEVVTANKQTPEQVAKPDSNKTAADKKPEQQRSRTDAAGNIVDANGNIIATAGVQRRLHEMNDRMRGMLAERDREINELRVSVRAAEILDGTPAKLGLSQEDTFNALKMAAHFRENPVEAARIVVAEALKKGYNLDDILGEQSGHNLNMAAIRGMIDERFAPMDKQREAAERTERAQVEAQRAWNEFLVSYPAAEYHSAALAELMRQDPRANTDHPSAVAERAYLRLEAFAARQGLDINQPLGPQIAARQNAAPTVPAPAKQHTAKAPLPPMNASRGVNSSSTSRPSQQIRADASWGEIMRQVKAELGDNNVRN